MRTSPLRRSGVDHTVLPANTPHLPLPRSSPEGATTEWTVIVPPDEAYYSLIDPVRMKGWVGLVYPYKWLPISCRSDADQWKFAGQRPTFCHPKIKHFMLTIDRNITSSSLTNPTVHLQLYSQHYEFRHIHTVMTCRYVQMANFSQLYSNSRNTVCTLLPVYT